MRKYEDKYYGNKPLDKWTSLSYPHSYRLLRSEISWSVFDFLYETMGGEILQYDEEIVFEIKVRPEKFTKYDFLASASGPAFVVHSRVVEKLSAMCPDDFQTFPVVIKNYNQKEEPFESREYLLINITHLVDSIDQEKSIVTFDEGLASVKNITFLENCMEGHLLARGRMLYHILFHPTLALEFVKSKSKGIRFLSDEDLRNRWGAEQSF